MKKLILCWAIILMFFIAMIPIYTENVSAADVWWNSSWTYYTPVTTDGDLHPALTNYPVLVNIDTATVAKCKANGEDIRFLDVDNSTEYFYEIDTWDTTGGGNTYVWVNITSLSDADYTFLMYYGNNGASDNQSTSTWDSNFKGVYHMNASTTKVDGCYDSTSNANHGLYYGDLPTTNTTPAFIGQGQEYDGTGDWLNLPSGCHTPASGTYEIMLEADSGAAGMRVFNAGDDGDYRHHLDLRWDVTRHDLNWKYGGGQEWVDADGTDPDTFKHYYAVGFESENLAWWQNETKRGTSAISTSSFTYDDFYIGVGGDAAYSPYDGIMDEIRISNIKRSDGWVGATYNISANADTFCSFGSEQTYSPPPGNTAPASSNEAPTNNTDCVSYVAGGRDLYALVTDFDGDNMNVTWTSNSSGAWIPFATNSSISNNTNITQKNVNFTTADTTYYWQLNITDGEEGYKNNSYHFKICANNSVPTFSNEAPTNQSTGLSLTPSVYVVVSDADSDTTTCDFYTSNDGSSWTWRQTNITVASGTNISYSYSQASSYSTKYYWKVTADDGTDNITSNFYDFTTRASPTFSAYDTQSFGGHIQVSSSGDTTIPLITINFAGNLSDSGGPYWRPPGENVALSGVWSDGYYTNDSRQSENFTYINLTISEPESDLTSVYLNWYNQSSDTWVYDTYSFSNMTGGFWEINTSEHFDVFSGHNYSFNINATSSAGTNWTAWNKTGIGGGYTRRYLQLNCTPTNVSYSSFYLYDIVTPAGNKKDRLHHDQGSDGAITDTGYLISDTPTDTIIQRNCSLFTGYWFDESTCVIPFTLDNIYFHVWWSDGDDHLTKIGWRKDRQDADANGVVDYFDAPDSSSVSNITYVDGNDNTHDSYHLSSELLDVTSTDFTDNDIYEIYTHYYSENFDNPSIICNISIRSFVLFNVPSNETLNASYPDSDSDGLSDYDELYTYDTHPFISDTDNDGVNDYDETLSGSDPNNYTDTKSPSTFTAYDTQSFGGHINISEGTIDIDVAPALWDAGNPNCDSSTTENFTFYQNGTATIDTKIGFNKTNYTFVSYATWLGDGHDQYCANFTTDTWVSETNIAPKVGGVPVTSLKTSVSGNTNFGFGIRICMPKTVSTANLREDFKVMFNATIS